MKILGMVRVRKFGLMVLFTLVNGIEIVQLVLVGLLMDHLVIYMRVIGSTIVRKEKESICTLLQEQFTKVNGFLIFRKATVLSVGLKAWNTLGNIAKVRSMAMASSLQLILNIKNRKYSKANLSITLYKERANIYTTKVVRESNMKVNG